LVLSTFALCKNQTKEKFFKNERHIQGKAVGFKIDTVRLVNGALAAREYLDHPGAVAVVAIPKPGHIVMVSQYRYPVAQMTWEIPAGKLNKGEKPEICVRRELEEETGYKAGRIRKLLAFWPTAAFANEVIHIYVADKLRKGQSNPDEDEFISCQIWSLKKLYQKIGKGQIQDSKTIIGALAYRFRNF
jgi:ADP-ribose pyrophosphatase